MNLDYSKISIGDLCDIADGLDERAYDDLCNEDEDEARKSLIELIEVRKDFLCNLSFPIKEEWVR